MGKRGQDPLVFRFHKDGEIVFEGTANESGEHFGVCGKGILDLLKGRRFRWWKEYLCELVSLEALDRYQLKNPNDAYVQWDRLTDKYRKQFGLARYEEGDSLATWNVYEVYKGKKLMARGHGFEIAPLLGITTRQISARMCRVHEATIQGYRVVVVKRGRPNATGERDDSQSVYAKWDRMTAYYRKLWGIPRYDGRSDEHGE